MEKKCIKGYVRRTFSSGVCSFLSNVGAFFSWNRSMAGRGAHTGDIYHLNDAGTPFLIRVLIADSEAPHLRWKGILLSKA